MKKLNVKGSLLLDGLISLSIISLLCFLLVPLMIKLDHTLTEKESEIEMKRLLATVSHKYSLRELKHGLQISNSNIYTYNDQLCITSKHKSLCTSI
ncbi:hypothetical protein N9R04_06470 [Staphylococcus sp. SQ8-PEA]|uniref:Late competence protein ComGE n=1 Tax=Staphylococcus marylandisciuri TaxID=2981529 RepID=A0ABT2QQY1_9STAP|nr:hypothetical protein [Staphylococcus marylandisciuri]MCU5746360.1 hypothetical protein [Staphylococcus marylandisciuri]